MTFSKALTMKVVFSDGTVGFEAVVVIVEEGGKDSEFFMLFTSTFDTEALISTFSTALSTFLFFTQGLKYLKYGDRIPNCKKRLVSLEIVKANLPHIAIVLLEMAQVLMSVIGFITNWHHVTTARPWTYFLLKRVKIGKLDD